MKKVKESERRCQYTGKLRYASRIPELKSNLSARLAIRPLYYLPFLGGSLLCFSSLRVYEYISLQNINGERTSFRAQGDGEVGAIHAG